MSFRDRFKSKKAGLQRQHNQQTKNKDGKTSYPSIIQKDKLPAGIEVWQCKEGDHLIDIIPFPAGSDFPVDPDSKQPVIDEGDLAYVLDIMVHTNVGTMRIPYVCPYENFGLPCPICEFMSENDLEKEDWKKTKAKRRTVYLVWVHDTRETQKKGIQLWEISHYTMEEKLAVIASQPRGGGAKAFADFDDGCNIAFTRKGAGMTNTQYLGHRFIDREVKIPDALLEHTFPVDQFVKMHPSYEEIEETFKGQKAKMSTTDDIDSAGNSFSEQASEEVPDWMKDAMGDDVPFYESDHKKKDDQKSQKAQTKAPARKFFRSKK